MKKTIMALTSVLALAACAKPLEVASITEINTRTGSKSIDVHEPKRAAGQKGLPEFAGDQLLEVRTYTTTDKEGRVELAGAQCTLSAADYSATLETPAKVRVPLYRSQSSALAVTCAKPGFKKASTTLEAMDITRQQRMSSGSGAGVLGFAVAAAFDAASDNSKNEWRYPMAALSLDPAPMKAP